MKGKMMKAKKWIAVMAAGAMAMSILSGCGNSGTSSDQSRADETTTAAQEEKGTEVSQTGENAAEIKETLEETGTAAESQSAGNDRPQGGKTLVVYYSASGHTEDVAKVIADAAEDR